MLKDRKILRPIIDDFYRISDLAITHSYREKSLKEYQCFYLQVQKLLIGYYDPLKDNFILENIKQVGTKYEKTKEEILARIQQGQS